MHWPGLNGKFGISNSESFGSPHIKGSEQLGSKLCTGTGPTTQTPSRLHGFACRDPQCYLTLTRVTCGFGITGVYGTVLVWYRGIQITYLMPSTSYNGQHPYSYLQFDYQTQKC